VEWRERLELVHRLPARQQRLLWLKAIGLSYTEIAAESGLTVRSVERQLQRGRARLRAAA
jgi:DNA-directed RNA polymerase specialized sigma24 family protein